ncbi:hypothetical protein HPB49_021626 [Dermacentor silvarum]|uniref:Uncharacterized protein n=1 Tax=Dermacentor silvarum TaxID=543639 RepID=A0ACB8E3E6_DERSI|nr:hypothetical protein HPB49_021626 [Dermacentor silvarum]
MSTVTAPKRRRRRKFKSKLSFGSTSSGPSTLLSNTKASLAELFAFHTLKPSDGKHQCGVARNAREAATSMPYMKGERLMTPRTTSTSDSRKPSDREQYVASASEDVESFIGDEQVIVRERPEPKALPESNVVDIVKQLREFLQENGPSEEEDLLKALSLSKAQRIIQVYGTLTAFLDRHPGFRVIHEHLYSFIYYQHPDDQDDEWECSSLVHDGDSTGSCAASTNESGRQYTVDRGDESRSARASSSSSSYYSDDSSYGDDKQEKRQMKNGWTQVPSLPRWESRALQAVPETCNAEAQTHGWDLTRFTEMQSNVKKSDAKIAELNEKAEDSPREPCPRGAGASRQDRRAARENTPSTTAECSGGNEQPPRHEPAEAHWHEWGARPSHPAAATAATASEVSTPSSQVPAEAARASHWRKAPSAKRPPLPKFHEFPGRKEQLAATCSDIDSMQSSPEGFSTKSKAECQITKIVQMVKKEQPDNSDDEIRRRLDQLRRSLGGFSKMTLSAIAALVIGRLKQDICTACAGPVPGYVLPFRSIPARSQAIIGSCVCLRPSKSVSARARATTGSFFCLLSSRPLSRLVPGISLVAVSASRVLTFVQACATARQIATPALPAVSVSFRMRYWACIPGHLLRKPGHLLNSPQLTTEPVLGLSWLPERLPDAHACCRVFPGRLTLETRALMTSRESSRRR